MRRLPLWPSTMKGCYTGGDPSGESGGRVSVGNPSGESEGRVSVGNPSGESGGRARGGNLSGEQPHPGDRGHSWRLRLRFAAVGAEVGRAESSPAAGGRSRGERDARTRCAAAGAGGEERRGEEGRREGVVHGGTALRGVTMKRRMRGDARGAMAMVVDSGLQGEVAEFE